MGGTSTSSYTNADVVSYKTARLEDADIVSIMLGYNDSWPVFEDGRFKTQFLGIAEKIEELYTTEPRKYVAQVPYLSARYEDSYGRPKGLFNNILELSQENNWPLIDFHTYMKPYQDNKAYCVDETHPNTVEAMWMMAEAIYGQLPCSELSDSDEITNRIQLRSTGKDPDAE